MCVPPARNEKAKKSTIIGVLSGCSYVCVNDTIYNITFIKQKWNGISGYQSHASLQLSEVEYLVDLIMLVEETVIHCS